MCESDIQMLWNLGTSSFTGFGSEHAKSLPQESLNWRLAVQKQAAARAWVANRLGCDNILLLVTFLYLCAQRK